MNAEPSLQITIGATEARSHFADLLKRVHRGKEHLIVEKGGISVAAIIGMREYDDFLRWRAQVAIDTSPRPPRLRVPDALEHARGAAEDTEKYGSQRSR